MKNISSENLLFILAYAFDIRWEYLKGWSQKEKIKDLTYLELLIFIVTKWTQELIKKGLSKSFITKTEDLKNPKGKINLSQLNLNHYFTHKLPCEFDELSLNTKENQLILSTLIFSQKYLSTKIPYSTESHQKSRQDLLLQVWQLSRILSKEIDIKPINKSLFQKITITRINSQYKPIIEICRLILDELEISNTQGNKFIDVSDEKMSQLFERFLKNYLVTQIGPLKYKIDRGYSSDWTIPDRDQGNNLIPSIAPDIVIWKNSQPVFIIDAKFYKEPVYMSKFNNSYKTHSHNLYQLISYTDYYNCDGLLVYPQGTTGPYDQMVKINQRYYSQPDNSHKFGFCTLDAQGDLDNFKNNLLDFIEKIKSKLSDEN